MFEPAQLPQETICPSVAFGKGQIGNSRGQHNPGSITTCVYSTILSGHCKVLNSEVERHFPPHVIRFQFFFWFIDYFICFTLKINHDFPLGHCSKEEQSQMKQAVNMRKSHQSQSRVNDASLILLPNMVKVILT